MAQFDRPFYRDGTGVRVMADGMVDLRKTLKLLAESELLVGFPDETADREPDPDEKTPATNASLAYIHDNGAPEAKIPARPFMIPGMTAVQDKAAERLAAMGRMVLKNPRPETVNAGLSIVGLLVVASIQKTIKAGVPPPLAESTLRARANRGGKGKGRRGAMAELLFREWGEAPSTEFAKPLIDTGQLLKVVNFVVRKRKKGAQQWLGSTPRA